MSTRSTLLCFSDDEYPLNIHLYHEIKDSSFHLEIETREGNSYLNIILNEQLKDDLLYFFDQLQHKKLSSEDEI